jgi:hypothetical protein
MTQGARKKLDRDPDPGLTCNDFIRQAANSKAELAEAVI